MIFHVPPEDPPACPKCAAAIQRAEQAEAMCEAWRLNCESATRLLAELQLDRVQLRKDLAAARRERDAQREWFGHHVWAKDDFGGLKPESLMSLFDLILPDWRDWTAEGKRTRAALGAAGEGDTG